MKSIQSRLITLVIAMLAAATVYAAPPEPKTCSSNEVCAKGEFCDTTPKCPDGKVTGVCKEKPEMCTMEYKPVIGCDGAKYSNACVAAAAGQPNTGPFKAK